VDEKRGYILLEDPLKYNTNIEYLVEGSAWIPLTETNMNPLKNTNTCFYYIWLKKDGSLYYSKSHAKHLLYSYENSSSTPILRTSDFGHIFTIKTNNTEYKYVDIRKRGGEVLDKTGIDLKSHTTYGYWGHEPTQLNAVLIELPDEALETMINQFNGKGATSYGFNLPANISEQNRAGILDYINSFEDTTPDTPVNLIQVELFETIRRYIPLGISVILTDTNGNELFKTKQNPDIITTGLGL